VKEPSLNQGESNTMKNEPQPERSSARKASPNQPAKSGSDQGLKTENKDQQNEKARSSGETPSAKDPTERSPRQENL
jgi:hypothetical protein